MTPTTGTPTFSARLRKVSWDDHEEAAGNEFFDRLLAGKLPLETYGLLVRQHLAVYEALEGLNTAARTDPRVERFVRPELDRVPSLRQDLHDVLGDRGTDAPVLPATASYVGRIAASEGDGLRFVAHHYVRYLGDLSGGQYIGRGIEKAYDIQDHRGTSFYVFEDIDDAGAFKDVYRQHLDQLSLSADEQQAMIDEVLAAYRLNTAMHADLAAAARA